jgi:uncharacterized ubiquitin-like protein YukD
MNSIFVNPKDGVICSAIDHELSLGRLIYLIKDAYPQVADDDIKIINKGHLLSGNDEKLSDLGVSINVDRLRVIPATSWKKFDKNNF